MTTISEKVLDVLVIGIHEEYARLSSMIVEYEDTGEFGPITKEMILDTYADLKEAILFHQQHVMGIKFLLMEEAFIGLHVRINTMLGQSDSDSNTIFGKRVPLPDGITVQKQVTEGEFQYIFEHVTLGNIGEIACKRGKDGTYGLATRPSIKGRNKKEKQKMLQQITDTLVQELQLNAQNTVYTNWYI